MITRTVKAKVTRVALVSACVLHLVGCTGSVALGPDAVKGKTPDGTVDMEEVQAAYIGSGSVGTGVLTFRGVQYPFQVGGVGVGGIGLSTVDAAGEVYNLRELAQFPGTYGQARYGFAIGTTSAGGALDAERVGRDPSPEREAYRADPEPRWRRRRHFDAAVRSAAALRRTRTRPANRGPRRRNRAVRCATCSSSSRPFMDLAAAPRAARLPRHIGSEAISRRPSKHSAARPLCSAGMVVASSGPRRRSTSPGRHRR